MTWRMKMNSDSFRMPYQGGIRSIYNRHYPEKFMASKSFLPLQLNFFNHRERECHCNRFRCLIHQSSTSFNPTMMRAQEQNLLNTFNYCHVSFNAPGGTPLYRLYRYMRPQRVWFFSRFCHKLRVSILPILVINRIWFCTLVLSWVCLF